MFILSEKYQLAFEEILLFACVLTSTDTVAGLSLVKESKFPQLNAIVFGEAIFNDAISIVLFRSVTNTFSKNA